MPEIPGTFLGKKVADMRVLMVRSIANYYKKAGLYDAIVKFHSYEKSEVVTFRTKYGLTKHVWQQTPDQSNWVIVSDDYVYDPQS